MCPILDSMHKYITAYEAVPGGAMRTVIKISRDQSSVMHGPCY